jgi:hypothetical protein
MIDVNDGRQRVGFKKPIAGGGFELFVATADEDVYIGKAKTLKEGAGFVRAARAARDGNGCANVSPDRYETGDLS